MTEAKYEELLALALGNQKLIAEATVRLIEVANNQSRRLDRVEAPTRQTA